MSTHIQRVRILYKTIMRLHRGMPPELELLGNNYARDEFKRHKTCTPEEANVFMHEWTDYAMTIAKQLGLRGPNTGKEKLGKQLNEKELDLFREEQIHQLYDLMLAAKAEDNNKFDNKT